LTERQIEKIVTEEIPQCEGLPEQVS